NLRLHADAIRYARRAIEIAGPGPRSNMNLANPLSLIADSQRFSGDLEGALRSILDARKRLDTAAFFNETARPSTTYNVLWREGAILGEADDISLNRPAEAIEALQRAFDVMEELAAKDRHDSSSRIRLSSAARVLGEILNQSDPARALTVYDKALERLGEVENNGEIKRRQARLEAGSSYALRRLRRVNEAKQRIDAAFQLLRETKDFPAKSFNPGDDVYFAIRALGDHLAETGEPQSAAALYRDLVE